MTVLSSHCFKKMAEVCKSNFQPDENTGVNTTSSFPGHATSHLVQVMGFQTVMPPWGFPVTEARED